MASAATILSTLEHLWNVVEQEKGIMDMQLINL